MPCNILSIVLERGISSKAKSQSGTVFTIVRVHPVTSAKQCIDVCRRWPVACTRCSCQRRISMAGTRGSASLQPSL